MKLDNQLPEDNILIVTGSNLRAEQADRPLAYGLKEIIADLMPDLTYESPVLVLSDLWYLHAETLHDMPMISIGGPSVNAVSAHLSQRLPTVLVADNTLTIQMDPTLEDLRVCVWGVHHDTTVNALELFVDRGYLEQLIKAAIARLASPDSCG